MTNPDNNPKIQHLEEIPLTKTDLSAKTNREQLNMGSLPDGWVDLKKLLPGLILDIKYATDQNFVGMQMYPCARCLLRDEVGNALVKVQQKLRLEGLGLKVFDCYRPWSVQKELWEKMPDPRYVTNPEKGSMHNRAAAVDLTLIDQNGHDLDMGTEYDFFGERAYHTFTELPASVLDRRRKLVALMEEAGFQHIRTEWWHYSYQLKYYEVSDYQWSCPDLAMETE